MFLYLIIIMCALSFSAVVLPRDFKFLSPLVTVLLGFMVPIISGADSLSAFFTYLVSLCALSVVFYSKGLLSSRTDSVAKLSLHYFSLSALYLSLVMVLNYSSGYGFLFAWELMSISSFFLMLLDGENLATRRAALNYLVFMHIGFVFLLSGFSLVDNAGYGFGFEGIAKYGAEHNPTLFFVLMLLGFGLKAGMFPLHVWMPESYDLSPAHVSSFMSGAVSKMGLYGIVRVVLALDNELFTIGIILLVVGALTGLWGVLCCALQNSFKRALAYSSIENMGIMLLMLSSSVLARYYGNDNLAICALGACLLHSLSHSLLKSLLFFSSGNVISSIGGEGNIERMGGVFRRMPISSSLFLVGALSICAFPCFSGFVSEFIVYYGLYDAVAMGGDLVILPLIFLVVLSLIGGLALFAFAKIFSVVFLGVERSDCVEDAQEVDIMRLVACVVPVAGILLIGVLPGLIVGGVFDMSSSLLSLGKGGFSELNNTLWMISRSVSVLMIVCFVIYYARERLLKGKKITKTPTWGCGFTSMNQRMQYSSESFARELHSLLPLSKKTDQAAMVPKDELFAGKHILKSTHGDKIDSLLKHSWMEFMRMSNSRVMKMRTGKVNYQVLYALFFLVIILVLSLLKLI